jgi:arylsulfatase A-like enzyme
MTIYPTLCELVDLPIPKHVEGRSIKALLAKPDAEWTMPALTTHGFSNHAVRTERWRYIRYEDGGEELYDHRNDPYEWTNLASRVEFASVKSDLAKSFPSKNAPEPVLRNRAIQTQD